MAGMVKVADLESRFKDIEDVVLLELNGKRYIQWARVCRGGWPTMTGSQGLDTPALRKYVGVTEEGEL